MEPFHSGLVGNLQAAFRLLWRGSDGWTRAGLAGAAILVMASSALAALSPILLKYIVDLLSKITALDANRVLTGFLIVGYAGTQWLGRLLSEIRMLVTSRTDQRLHRRLSSQLLAQLLSLPISGYFNLKPGVVSQVLANGLIGYRLIVQHATSSVLPVVLELALIGSVLVVFGHGVFLAIIGTAVACYIVVFYMGGMPLTEAARRVSSSQIEATAFLTESVQSIDTIKYFCAEQLFERRYKLKLQSAYKHWGTFLLRRGVHGILMATIFALSLLASTYIAGRKAMTGQMTVGDFVLVNTYMIQMFRPLETLNHAFRDIAQALAFIERLVDLFRNEVEFTISGDKCLPPGRGHFRFDRVTFSYKGQPAPVLNQVSFDLVPGRKAAVVGPSGCGKTSLIRLLFRLFEPDSGQIFLDDVSISEINVAKLRDVIAVVPQDIVLFDDTVANNIAVGNQTSTTADIYRAAVAAGIHEVIASWPHGYQTVVGERGIRLSGGERQRIAIARAVVKRPRLLIFDEATSALDPSTERQILSRVADYQQGSSMLIVAHRLSTIVDADEILVLAGGSIVDRGTHRDLLRSSGIYRDMWLAQQRRFL